MTNGPSLVNRILEICVLVSGEKSGSDLTQVASGTFLPFLLLFLPLLPGQTDSLSFSLLATEHKEFD